MIGAAIALAVLAYLAMRDEEAADKPTSIGMLILLGGCGYGAQALVEGAIAFIGRML